MTILGNVFFHFIHLLTIFFCLLGWLFEPLLFFNLIVLFAVAFSWFVLGYFFGFGYCFFTDMHWKFKRYSGENPATESYVKYMIDKVGGMDSNAVVVDQMTSCLFFVSLAISLVLNFDVI